MRAAVFILLSLSLTSIGQDVKPFEMPKVYEIPFNKESIEIDGKAEKAWDNAAWSSDFIDIFTNVIPAQRTRVKMLWDSSYLYFYAELQEENVWATLKDRDAIIYRDNDFEIFIDPDGDTHNYMELEINAFNTLMDLFMVSPYRDRGPMLMDWDMNGTKSAVHINGTLNDPSDKDESWTVEVAIPMAVLSLRAPKLVPGTGDYWKINYSRVQWHVDDDNQKIKGKPEENWVWSQQGVINMHCPEYWGIAHFGTMSDERLAEIESIERMKWKLRQVYYLQKAYKKEEGEFAKSFRELSQDPTVIEELSDIEIVVGKGTYVASTGSGEVYSINEKGRVWKP